jgi:hypothetical protein
MFSFLKRDTFGGRDGCGEDVHEKGMETQALF